MAIHYTTSAAGNLLTVQAWGWDEDLADVVNYGSALIEASVASGCTHLLCDERELEYRLGTLDTYQAAKYMAEQAPHMARVAILPNAKYFKDARFWENVASNRGLTVRVFNDLVAARQWLAEL